MQEKLDAAVAAWTVARAAHEAASSDDTTQAMFDAEEDVLAEHDALTGRLTDLSQLLGAIDESLAARKTILEQSALDAERSAKHYDQAEKGHAEREKLEEIEEARVSLEELTRSLNTMRRTLEEL
jgi:hypothetical protein